jgi:hypothetical protein
MEEYSANFYEPLLIPPEFVLMRCKGPRCPYDGSGHQRDQVARLLTPLTGLWRERRLEIKLFKNT